MRLRRVCPLAAALLKIPHRAHPVNAWHKERPHVQGASVVDQPGLLAKTTLSIRVSAGFLYSHRSLKGALVWRYFWGAHQRFFRDLCIASKVPATIEQAQQALKQDKVGGGGCASIFGSGGWYGIESFSCAAVVASCCTGIFLAPRILLPERESGRTLSAFRVRQTRQHRQTLIGVG